MNIAWLTDIHLNFLKTEAREKFYQQVMETSAESILITGDIAESKDVCELLTEFCTYINMPIYFVLGNHDYYFGSVSHVRERIRATCMQNEKLIWLNESKVVKLTDDAVLIGQDGWADARYGDFDHSLASLNDSRVIAELYQAFLLNKSALKTEMQKLADNDATSLQKTLSDAVNANIKKMVIATHIPPFPECSWHKDKPSDENWLPYFASKATGDVVSDFAQNHPDIQFLVLCV